MFALSTLLFAQLESLRVTVVVVDLEVQKLGGVLLAIPSLREPNLLAMLDEALPWADPRGHVLTVSRAIAMRSLSQGAARLANAQIITGVAKRPVTSRCVSYQYTCSFDRT